MPKLNIKTHNQLQENAFAFSQLLFGETFKLAEAEDIVYLFVRIADVNGYNSFCYNSSVLTHFENTCNHFCMPRYSYDLQSYKR